MSSIPPLPEGPLVAWYGDDFTGAGAVLEVLSVAGLPSVLFLKPPTPADLMAFPGMRGIGIAGEARTQSLAWMDTNLPAAFAALRATGARIIHYKVCSTLDSAPHIGSIGRAAEIGLTGNGWAPVILAAPGIGRWQAFGNLFAAGGGGGGIHRLDRHPTMAVHPVTPMDEADVGLHLARQTGLPVGLVDLVALKSGAGADRLAAERRAGARLVAFDVVDDATLAAAGALVWRAAAEAPLFAVGSQGLEYALIAAWSEAGVLPAAQAIPQASPAQKVAVVSGSCSPVTAEQIRLAAAAGFETIPLDLRSADWRRELATASEAALAVLARGESVIVYSALGEADPAISGSAALRSEIGAGLGWLLDRLTISGGLQRVAVAGGDTSGAAMRAFKLHALTAAAQLAPGTPVLRGHSMDPDRDGIEIVLKGGQMGPPDFFLKLRDGTRAA